MAYLPEIGGTARDQAASGRSPGAAARDAALARQAELEGQGEQLAAMRVEMARRVAEPALQSER